MSPRNRRPDTSGELLPDEGGETMGDVSANLVEPAAVEPTGENAEPPRQGRLSSLRVASLHLRMGQHALARAELEAFAGRGLLDDQALLDLAEVRWRSGDLVGATEAAAALIARGHETLLALVIAAEGFAVTGRPTEARRLALRAVELAGAGLESVFAGMPSSRIWPDGLLPSAPASAATDPTGASAGAAELAGLAVLKTPEPEVMPDAGQQVAEAGPELQPAPERVELQPDDVPEVAPEPAEPEPESSAAEPEPTPVDALDVDADEQAAEEAEAAAAAAVRPPSPADNAIAAAAVAMHSGRVDQASLLFGLALRLDPSSAAYVLIQLGAPAPDPRLALVEGDALQLLGRDAEAREAFGRAGGSLFDGGHKG